MGGRELGSSLPAALLFLLTLGETLLRYDIQFWEDPNDGDTLLLSGEQLPFELGHRLIGLMRDHYPEGGWKISPAPVQARPEAVVDLPGPVKVPGREFGAALVGVPVQGVLEVMAGGQTARALGQAE